MLAQDLTYEDFCAGLGGIGLAAIADFWALS